MKKLTLALLAVLAFSFSLKAQQFVSTQPTNRNVVIEEFTGRNCTYCPQGHVVANQITHDNPGRVWAINVHCGGYAPTNYPNFNTTDGANLLGGFNVSGFPAGTVNRCGGANTYGRNQWSSLANAQLSQQAEVNVGGRVIINPAARLATVTVEIYYTGNSDASTNYLTVAMVQDSIWGSQTGGSSNPEQYVGGQYCHMHILRDIINGPTWGDAVAPTTAGTLVTKEFSYEIPEVIGNPNGSNAVLEHLHFIAMVSKDHFYVLNANQLDVVMGSDDPIFPFLKSVAQEANATCTHSKIVNATIMNGGTETLTSMTLEANIAGQTFTADWTGNLPQFSQAVVEIPVEVPFGTYEATMKVVSANGQACDGSDTFTASCLEWTDVEAEGEEEQIELQLMQDKFGNQITWEATASDGTVLASGGPYAMLMGSTGTQLHIERFNVPANECVKFTINDNVGNGICCSYGQGYFVLYDSKHNVLFGDENDGAFGESASCLLSIKGSEAEVTVGATEYVIESTTSASFISSLDYIGYPDGVGFEYRKVTSSEVTVQEGIINEFKNILASVNDLEENAIYVVKAYAIVNGETYYGPETTFNMIFDNVSEFEGGVKVYPNPATNVLNVEGAEIASVEVFNAMGQQIVSMSVEGKAQINTSGLNNGIYFVRIYSKNGEMKSEMFSVVK